MKRTPLLCFAIFGLLFSATAHPVDMESAKAIASKFMGTNDLQLAATYTTDNNAAAFYVLNSANGFVIVAADDCETPIIGYSHEGRFDPDNVPVQMEEYLQDFVTRIQYGIENQIVANEASTRQWQRVKSTGRLTDRKNVQAVTPLLTDKWNQGCRYNSLCPTIQGPCDHAEVGCVAVAMGQIMHYWHYPATGWGSHSYNNSGTTLSADFGSTTYDWEHMPDSLTESSSKAEIEAVATLLYHCGISVRMNYGPNGSNAKITDVPNALRRYFSYSRQLHLEKKKDFSNEEWIALLKGNLNQQQPVLYSGSSSNIGHAFVCDGYDDNDLFHFNWGWGVADGYFSLGNLNPIGFDFNNNNQAIFDIIPQYEPCIVYVTAYPPSAGTIDGAGEYHIGAQCTLTATPAEDYKLFCWKRDEQGISNSPTFTFPVEDDTVHIVAHFSCYPVGQITASYSPDASSPTSPNISLSWTRSETEWRLLNQFEIGDEIGGMATDGEHIYITYAEWNNPPFLFGKYTMDGVLLEKFNIEGLPSAVGLGYDGASFYCNSAHSGLSVLYRTDLENKTILDSTDMNLWFGAITYDPEYDGFWLGRNYQAILFDRQGHRIRATPTTYDYLNGTAYFTAKDGTHHLIESRESGVYSFDIGNDFLSDYPLLSMGEETNPSLGTCSGEYEGKEALFIVIRDTAYIYETKSILEQIVQIDSYRLYRADSESDTLMLADGIAGSSFIDTCWDTIANGTYRYGISEVFANGNESEIVWSNTIEKTNFGLDENEPETPNSHVQKVFENGQIVIVKDGKRYTVTGQRLK